jgi:ankyrin repeat protein
LDGGADVNAKCNCPGSGYGGATALMIAARNGGLEGVKALLAKGADVNQRDENGSTALALAVRGSSNPSVVRLLKESKGKQSRD